MQENQENQLFLCPSCDSEIQIDELVKSTIKLQLESEYNEKRRASTKKLELERRVFEKEKEQVEERKKSVDAEVEALLRKRSSELEKAAEEKAANKVSLELASQADELRELQKDLATSKRSELELLKEKRKLEQARSDIELEVARKLNDEKKRLVAAERERLNEDFKLKLDEKEKTIKDLKNTADVLQRKADQGSQQLQGEVQELALEKLLEDEFFRDTIAPVKKGVKGGDCLQLVSNTRGQECGSILWESKRTKAWSNKWLEKLRDDQRSSKSAYAVIVSSCLPPDVTSFTLRDGVWICSWQFVVPLASALRSCLIDVGKANRALEGRSDKMSLLYQYLSGPEFVQRIEAIVESHRDLSEELEKERRSMARLWARREKSIMRALNSTAGLYGAAQGIIGSTLPQIEELTLGEGAQAYPKLGVQGDGIDVPAMRAQ